MQVACGLYHAAALTCCGKLYVWGTNISGILGSASPEKAFLPQVITHFNHPVTAVAMSKIRRVAVCRLSNGKVYAWGALSRRLDASSSEPVRTPFSHTPAALIHFDMEFQMFWGLKSRDNEQGNRSGNNGRLQAMLSTPSMSTYMPSTPVYDGFIPTHVPATPLYAPSTPVYVPSTPLYTPSTPHYVPSTPTYSQQTPTYAPSTPTYVPSTPTYVHELSTSAQRTPTYAPSTLMYPEETPQVIDYNHGLLDTPIQEPPRTPTYDHNSFRNCSPPRNPTKLPRSPPAPSDRSTTRTRKLLNEYHHMMNLLNPPKPDPWIVPTPPSRPEANPFIITAPSQPSDVSVLADVPSSTPRHGKRSEAKQSVGTEPPPVKKSRFSDAPNDASKSRDNTARKRNGSPPRRKFMKQFSVPAAAASAIIGPGGYNIRHLKRATNTHIQVLGNRKSRYQLIIIEGPNDDVVEQAFNVVREIIRPYQAK